MTSPQTPAQHPAFDSRPIVIRSSIWRAALGVMLGIIAAALIFGFGVVLGVGGSIAAFADGTLVERSPVRDGWGGEIVVVPIEGGIDGLTSRFVAECSRELSMDLPRAIVLRVDSGGGEVAASDQVWRAVEGWKARGIPVIASFGGTAASGGYYVACGCDSIVAEPTCVTGSIGVIAQMFTLKGLTDEVGIAPVTIVASGSPRKDVANDMFRPWTEDDRQVILGILDDAYRTFISRVHAGRKAHFKELDDVRQVADGSVYTAAQAKERGLVDSIGYLDEAIAEAERAAGIAKGTASVTRLMQPPSLFGSPFGASSPLIGIAGRDLRDIAAELSQPRLMYQLNW